MIVLKLLMIHFVIVWIIDFSDITTSVKRALSKKRKITNIKPFDCSKCMNVWAMLLLCFFYFHLGIELSLFVACFFGMISDISFNLIDKLIFKLNKITE